MTDPHPTSSPATSDPRRDERLLTMASGGWVLLVAFLVCSILVAWAVLPVFSRVRAPGDGKNVETYGFDLGNCQVPRAELVPAMLHRDMVPVMDTPQVMAGREITALNEARRGKYLVDSDRVVGVELNGAARAYPISVLNVHEVVNDVLADRPVAVTYHWPCDSVRVFDRTVGERTLDFGVSGLVYNGNLLLYDRHADAGAETGTESLWSQLLARAVAGPAVGATLTVLHADVTTWADWLAGHPDTTVILPETQYKKRYKHAAPTAYFLSGSLLHPVRPAIPPDGPEAKTPVVAVQSGAARRVYPLSLIRQRADADGRWHDDLGGTTVHFDCGENSVVVTAPEPGPDLAVTYAFWFAWHAMHPGDELAGETLKR